jgi:hypothetical protein
MAKSEIATKDDINAVDRKVKLLGSKVESFRRQQYSDRESSAGLAAILRELKEETRIISDSLSRLFGVAQKTEVRLASLERATQSIEEATLMIRNAIVGEDEEQL